MSDLLEENYHSIQKQIALSAEKVGRDPASVRMMAVSKKMEPEKIRVIWRLGHRLFGENRVQEAKVKIPEMPTRQGLDRILATRGLKFQPMME
ncbi:MAG: hypothetical protein EBW82_03140, partial [Verrucomicrobia bacterium]|nr:hypothetical protein [Verrucomicrobiota bacterium]